MANTIYDLKLHELTFFTNKDDDVIKILRVPGGWIYSFLIKSESDTKMIFIPYIKESYPIIDVSYLDDIIENE